MSDTKQKKKSEPNKTLAEVVTSKTGSTKKTKKLPKINTGDQQGSIDDTIVVKFKLEDGVQVPIKAKPGDIGMDVYAKSFEYDIDNDCYIYHTGIRCEMPEGVGCFILLRSSNCRTDAYMPNSIGLIDTEYRGELIIKLKDRTSTRNEFMVQSLYSWNNLPWYEKLFTTFDEFDAEKWVELRDDIEEGLWAPYEVGEKIGQLVFLRFPNVEGVCVEELSETVRGEGGFGSTGK